jgi:hypothetical protein
MAYSPTYENADLDDIVADGLGTAGATVIGFIAIIVIGAVVIWGYRKMKGVR